MVKGPGTDDGFREKVPLPDAGSDPTLFANTEDANGAKLAMQKPHPEFRTIRPKRL